MSLVEPSLGPFELPVCPFEPPIGTFEPSLVPLDLHSTYEPS